jgi:hypothetical protein
MVSVILLSDLTLIVIMLSVIMVSVIMLSVIILSAVTLNVVAPPIWSHFILLLSPRGKQQHRRGYTYLGSLGMARYKQTILVNAISPKEPRQVHNLTSACNCH